LVDVGGHKQAAGFTIENKNLKTFIAEAENKAGKLIKESDLERVTVADIKIPISKINLEVAKILEKLEPFGIGNPRPLFLSQAELINAQLFGKTSNHLKIFVGSLELIGFNQANKFSQLSRGQKIEVIYTAEIDLWNNQEKLSGKLISFIS
jgi:single-stranded-DNA-specific exonuclease